MANGNLGAIYQKQGELEKALPLLETAVRQDPQFTAARYCLGLVPHKETGISARSDGISVRHCTAARPYRCLL